MVRGSSIRAFHAGGNVLVAVVHLVDLLEGFEELVLAAHLFEDVAEDVEDFLLDGVEGGFTRNFLNNGEQSTIYDASVAYQAASTPLVILAGKEYGSGSSRDWAAKGTALLGVRAVIAESFERIHRSNLIGMGVLPLQFVNGENAQSLGLTGEETFTISGITALNDGGIPKEVQVTAGDKTFAAKVRIDTPGEADYYRHGGIMQYVLRSLRG